MDKTTIILVIAVVVLIGVIVYLVRRYNYNRIMAHIQSIPTRATTVDIVQYEEFRRYQASWGAWYVQIKFADGQIVELKFDHEPTPEEIYPIAEQVWLNMQPTIILEAEDGTEI